jgi:hypothetical protein
MKKKVRNDQHGEDLEDSCAAGTGRRHHIALQTLTLDVLKSSEAQLLYGVERSPRRSSARSRARTLDGADSAASLTRDGSGRSV